MHALDSMTITANKDEVLETLRNNRGDHEQIVKEARKSYMDSAQKALQAKMGQLAEGKLVRLDFRLEPPQSHIKVYDTAIQMLELHTGDEIELDSSQVRNLMMDQWDWQQRFLNATSLMSEVANNKMGLMYGDDE